MDEYLDEDGEHRMTTNIPYIDELNLIKILYKVVILFIIGEEEHEEAFGLVQRG